MEELFPISPEGQNAWTFGICTDGRSNVAFHRAMIDSIKQQNIPLFEIIFATENPHFSHSEDHVRVLYINTKKKGHITRKKNEIARAARYPNLCLMHDYMILDTHWFSEFKSFGYDWGVCSSPFLLPNNARWWDWATWRGPRGHDLAPYNEPADQNYYVPGAYFCVKRSFLLEHPLNEQLVWGDDEDVEWSRRICTCWHYVFNPQSIVRSLKMKK